MTSESRKCIDCGGALPPQRTRPALRCKECNRTKRRIKQRAEIACLDCGVVFAPPEAMGALPERCAACKAHRKREKSAARQATWRAADPERRRKYDREYQAMRRLDPAYRERRNQFEMIRKYDMTMAQFEELLAAQNGLCAICGGTANGPGTRLHIDHCHESNKVRGLLCGKCNTAIGLLDDDPNRAESAAAYLRL